MFMISKTLYTLCASLSILSAAYAGPDGWDIGADRPRSDVVTGPGIPGYLLGPNNGSQPVRSYYTTNQGGTTPPTTDASSDGGIWGGHLRTYLPSVMGTNVSVDPSSGAVYDNETGVILALANHNGVVRDPRTGAAVAQLRTTPSGHVFIGPIGAN